MKSQESTVVSQKRVSIPILESEEERQDRNRKLMRLAEKQNALPFYMRINRN